MIVIIARLSLHCHFGVGLDIIGITFIMGTSLASAAPILSSGSRVFFSAVAVAVVIVVVVIVPAATMLAVPANSSS